MMPSGWLTSAAERLAPHILRTPLTYDPDLDLYLKWESKQLTGSFKLRGAMNKVLTLQPWELERGLVAASAGNHGQGLALAGRKMSAPVIIFASEHAVPAKVAAMRQLGADVHLTSGGYGDAEQAGLAYAYENAATWVSAYNDGQVIAGQGTLAIEALVQLTQFDPSPAPKLTWVAPVGGGGLAAGIGCVLSAIGSQFTPRPHRLVAVQSEASSFFHAIFQHGTQTGQVELPSLADGLAGPVEENSITISILQNCLDDFILVSEVEIQKAIVFAWKRYGEVIEGSAAAALAAVLSGKIVQRPALVVITGGNIQPEIHASLCAEYSGFTDLPIKH